MKHIPILVLLAIMIFAAGCSGESSKPVKILYTHESPSIGKTVPDIELETYHNGEIKKLRTGQYRGKWLILFFYPGDFTFVCPTELKDMAEHYDRIRKSDAEVISVSTDSVYAHRGWAAANEDIKKIRFPMASDRPGKLSRVLGAYDENSGASVRASFIVNPDGKIVAVEMTDEAIGRSAAELLRKLEAAVAIRESGGDFCPANWHAGEEMITPK